MRTLTIAAIALALFLGGFVLHDRSQAIAQDDRTRLAVDDAAIGTMSLATGVALAAYDFGGMR
jgi:hypothetical protein